MSKVAVPADTLVRPGWAYADSTVTVEANSTVPAPAVVRPACSVLLLPNLQHAPAFTVTLPPMALAPPLSRNSPSWTSSVPVLVSVAPCVVVPTPVLRSVPLFSVRTLKLVPASSRIPRLSKVPTPDVEAPAGCVTVPWFSRRPSVCSTPPVLMVMLTELARMRAWLLAPVRKPPVHVIPPLTVTEPCVATMLPPVHVIVVMDQVLAPPIVWLPPVSSSGPAPAIVEPAVCVVLLLRRRVAPLLIVAAPPITLLVPLTSSVPASTSRVPVVVSALPSVVVPAPVLRMVPEFRVRTLKFVPASSSVPRLSRVPTPETVAPASSVNVPWFSTRASVWGTPADIVDVEPPARTSAAPLPPLTKPLCHVKVVVTVSVAATVSCTPLSVRAPTVAGASIVTRRPPGRIA